MVGREGTIVRTTNGGATWVAQDSGTTSWLNGVSMTDENTGTAVGDEGTILRTTDGGATWVRQNSGTQNSLNGVSMTDREHRDGRRRLRDHLADDGRGSDLGGTG